MFEDEILPSPADDRKEWESGPWGPLFFDGTGEEIRERGKKKEKMKHMHFISEMIQSHPAKICDLHKDLAGIPWIPSMEKKGGEPYTDFIEETWAGSVRQRTRQLGRISLPVRFVC